MPVDVITPTYQNLASLRAFLARLESQVGGIGTVFVCVDGSTDGTVDFLATYASALHVESLTHPGHENRGRAATRNLAIPHLRAEFVLLLDSDMEPRLGLVESHMRLLARPGWVSVGDVVYGNATENLWARYMQTRGKGKYPRGAEIRALDFTAANAAMRTEDLVAIGGFDETFVEYGGEDTELALRLERERGVRFIYNGDAVAESEEWKSVDSGIDELRRYAGVNLPRIRARYPDAPAHFLVDRADSQRPRDRLFRAFMNPVSDAIADALLPHTPFAIQRRLLNYKVVRAVFQAYTQARRSPAT